MDLYSNDQKLTDFEDEFMTELDGGVFSPNAVSMSSMDSYNMDEDWLDRFFEDPVLNDRMISEAMQPPHIKSEHSYSLSKDNNGTPTNTALPKTDKDMDTDYLLTNTMNPSLIKVKEEPMDDTKTTIVTTTSTVTTSPQSLIKPQPTIIVATQQPFHIKQEQHMMVPKVSIKVEPAASPVSSCGGDQSLYDSIDLPPTPPSSTNSDSEGSLSPGRSAPSSPVRPISALRSDTLRTISQQPLFSSPIPTSGILVLSEEEKRTLISEGYPIPNKLPLTKQEEKNLKKIRRKIKNKISAQESRRKKKEYLESLEKRVESFSQENNELRKKVDNLENNNRSLLGQLQKLQAMVGKASSTSTAGGTCLMVLVLCFAVFFGGAWSPLGVTSMGSMGYSSDVIPQSVAVKQPMGPVIKDPLVDYATPNLKSRVLLSHDEELSENEQFGPLTPYLYQDVMKRLFTSAEAVTEPPVPQVLVQTSANETIENETIDTLQVDRVVAVDARQINATA